MPNRCDRSARRGTRAEAGGFGMPLEGAFMPGYLLSCVGTGGLAALSLLLPASPVLAAGASSAEAEPAPGVSIGEAEPAPGASSAEAEPAPGASSAEAEPAPGTSIS